MCFLPGLALKSRSELTAHPEVVRLFADKIARSMKSYARVVQIRKFTLLDAEWSQETEELTPTLEIKRRVINTKYAREIQAMYPDD